MDHTPPASTTRYANRWIPDATGSALGFIAAVLSVTPSLLPRPAVFQGIIVVLSFAFGYLAGVLIAKGVRRMRGKEAPRSISPRWFYGYVAAWIAALIVLPGAAVAWQNDVRRLVSMPPLDGTHLGAFFLGFLITGALVVAITLGVRRLYSRFRKNGSWGRATALTVAVIAAIIAALALTVVFGADRFYRDRNALPDSDMVEPDSQYRSAGSESIISWDSLGRHGADFVGGGPSMAEIEALTGEEAMEPIRVYAGLASAPTMEERADLVVAELERTGAFDREVLAVAIPTGSGWLEPQTVDALEYVHGGDTAIASMQYAYTPSWVSYIFDPDAPMKAAGALFDAVEERWSELPEDDRPHLVIYGLSLGAYGGQSVFTDVDDLRARTDGALFVGSPHSSELWKSLQLSRDPGSPAWQPVLDDGREVRWMSRDGDENKLTGPWLEPRVLYLQHATDPVTWLAPDVYGRAPDWLKPDQRSPELSTSMRWIPVVTGLQVTLDMLVAEAVPAAYGHNYGDVVVDAWRHVTPETGLGDEALTRIQAEIATYAAIPRYDW